MNNLEARITSLEEYIRPLSPLPAIMIILMSPDGTETPYCIERPGQETEWLINLDGCD